MKQSFGKDVPPSEAVIQAVSDYRSCSPTELPPLQDHIDIEGFDALFTDNMEDEAPTIGSVIFDYDNLQITVTTKDHLTVSITEQETDDVRAPTLEVPDK